MTVSFLAEWALRSSILILFGMLLLRALRVKDAAIVLAAWTAMLCASLAIPALSAWLPAVPLPAPRGPERAAPAMPPAIESFNTTSQSSPSVQGRPAAVAVVPRVDWGRIAIFLYLAIAGAMLLRLGAGVVMSLRLLRRSGTTGLVTEGIEVRESERIASPVALGIVLPAIVLPPDWREWDAAKLEAVLAHERSHIRRFDPAVQLLSAIHRALLWYSPLSWYLHRTIVRVAEDASDDAAVAATGDRAGYAEVLLEFMQRGVRGAGWQGVSIARYGPAEKRIQRVLDAMTPSRGVTRRSLAALLVLGAPLAYVAVAARPQAAPLSTAPRTEKPLKFEVVSVKPAVPPPASGGRKGGGGPTGPGTPDPSRIHRPAMRLKDIVLAAYNIEDFRVVGPDWLNGGWSDESTRFVIDAILPPGTTKEQLAVMWKHLLEERFKLAIHREFRELPKYSLIAARNGVKMKESAPDPEVQEADVPRGGRGNPLGEVDMYGLPIGFRVPPEGGAWRIFLNGRARIGGQQAKIPELAGYLADYLRSPVTDDTGLSGKYDFVLTFSRPRMEGVPLDLPEAGKATSPEALDALPDLYGALQSQLGLKLEAKKGPVEVIVIDHIEKMPTEN